MAEKLYPVKRCAPQHKVCRISTTIVLDDTLVNGMIDTKLSKKTSIKYKIQKTYTKKFVNFFNHEKIGVDYQLLYYQFLKLTSKYT